jgi:hypothetical protein
VKHANKNMMAAAAPNVKKPSIFLWKDKNKYAKALIKGVIFLIKVKFV